MKNKIKAFGATLLLFFAAVHAEAAIFSCTELSIPGGSTYYDFYWDWNSTDFQGSGSFLCCDYTDVASFSAFDIVFGQWIYYNEPLYFGAPVPICFIDLPPSCCCGSYGGVVLGCS